MEGPPLSSSKRVAIVTGGSRGIGAAISNLKRLAADGYAVVVNYASRDGPASALVEEILKSGGR